MTISSEEAQQIAIGVATAMIQNDKVAREAVYSDLEPEDLKKVLRWTTRWLITHMSMLCHVQGVPFDQAWESFAMTINYIIENDN